MYSQIVPFQTKIEQVLLAEIIFLYLISEAKILNFLGETEQNEYIVQNYYMTIKEEDGVTYLKEIIMY